MDDDEGEEFRYETPSLAAGRYRFKISEDPANPGGDADLYLRADAQPTTTEWDCRPYLSGSEETCTVTLEQEAVIHVMVRGWSNRDNFFILDGAKLEESQWSRLHTSGTVLKDHEDHYETEILPAGHYEFELSGTADADLYLRVGSQPTTSEWDCRPFSSTSNELCTIETEAEAKIHIMVRGWAATSTYELKRGAKCSLK